MTDERPDPNAHYNHGNIDQVDLQVEMQRSYLDYAMSVMVGGAVLAGREGRKRVPRRVL